MLLSIVYSSAAFAGTVYDDFNLKQWTVLTQGTGFNIHEASQRLEIALSADSVPQPGSNRIRGGYRAKCQLRGDFDIQVSYALVNFPTANGVRVGLAFGYTGAVFSIARASRSEDEEPRGEVYQGTDRVGTGIVATSDRRGRLRSVRKDGRISGYYFDAAANTWVHLGTTNSLDTSDMPFLVAIWSYDSVFEHKPVKAALDDVIVNAGTLVGPECLLAGTVSSGVKLSN
jgi:hypothetical protein